MARGTKANVVRGPVILAGSHEPLIFRRRTGYASADEEERFLQEHSEEVVEGLAKRGITWLRIHFFKGFGLEAEAEEIEMTGRLVELCHQRGIKVELYTQFGTLQYETFLAEEPEMLSWCVVTEEGTYATIVYGHHDFRMKPCLVRDGYWEYFTKVLDHGMDVVKGDGFGFDNVGAATEPQACHCPECRAAFVEFLRGKYKPHTKAGRALATERFGFAVLDHIRPPTFNRWSPPVACRIIKNPVFQEWMEFRSESLRRRFVDIWNYVKHRRPEMLIEYNVYPPFGSNSQWWNGIDMHRLAPWTDAFWNERPPQSPEFRADGLFWHKVHAYKVAQAHRSVVFTGLGGKDLRQSQLSMAESLAFNQGHLGHLGYPPAVARGARPEADAFIAFRTEHPELFEDTESVAEVGLVESSPSLAHNSVETHYAEVLALGSLLAAHLPFDLVPTLSEEALSRYPVLVLADVECLREEEAEDLVGYVESGGGLVLTERTSLYDTWRRRRRTPALEPLLKEAKGYENLRFGGEAGENINVAQSEGAGLALRGTFGQGRFAYLSRLEPVKPFGYRLEDDSIDPSHWHLPKNYEQFIEAVEWAGKGGFTIHVTAPQGLAAEARRAGCPADPAGRGRLLIHLVNYHLERAAYRVAVTLSGPKVTEAQLWTVGERKPTALRLRRSSAGAYLSVGRVDRYAIVEVS